MVYFYCSFTCRSQGQLCNRCNSPWKQNDLTLSKQLTYNLDTASRRYIMHIHIQLCYLMRGNGNVHLTDSWLQTSLWRNDIYTIKTCLYNNKAFMTTKFHGDFSASNSERRINGKWKIFSRTTPVFVYDDGNRDGSWKVGSFTIQPPDAVASPRKLYGKNYQVS
jgi:hypothetical protein